VAAMSIGRQLLSPATKILPLTNWLAAAGNSKNIKVCLSYSYYYFWDTDKNTALELYCPPL